MAGPRIGADVGGTFTDIVAERADGSHASLKLLTTHDAPERAVLEGIARIADETGIAVADVDQIIHGTTLATNALIQRSGARTCLVTTEGFRDVIETRTESRFEQYDLNIVLPKPLIERADRHTVRERLNARGEELIAFDEQGARALVERIGEAGYESVAVGFIHSYRNPVNEQRFRELLHAELPHVACSISSEVSPQMREYERFNTVCANAYVQPLMASYLTAMRDRLHALGARCGVQMIHSGGGLMSLETAAAFPVRLVESGPAGGAIFAADLARRYGRDRVLSLDMGGTTAKISMIDDCAPQTAKTFEVDRTSRFKKGSGMPVSIPVIEMIEIGAGGGSIAWIDRLRQIRIGPQSAGSEPGPACYGLGGSDATVTDANLVRGRLHPATFGAEQIDLSPSAAAAAVDAAVGGPLGLGTLSAAVGITEVVDENMTNAARVHAVENGKDLAGYTMIAFGGGGPLHAGRLIDKLGLDELIVPADAGVGSAIGFLRAPFSYEAVRSFYTSTADFDVAGANAVLAELASEALSFVRQGHGGRAPGEVVVERQVAMRYKGQGWEIPVRLDDGAFDDMAAELLAAKFAKAYEEFFGRAIAGLDIETVSWSVRAATLTDPPDAVELTTQGRPADAGRREPVDGSGHADCREPADAMATVARTDLRPGDTVSGPALITERQTTTVLEAGHRAVVQADGALLIRRSADRAAARSAAT